MKLTEGVDYALTYKNNVKPGKATMKITGIGKYTDSVSKTFTINKKANPMVVVGKNVTMALKKLNSIPADKKGLTFQRKTAITIRNQKGDLSYEMVSVTPVSKTNMFNVTEKGGIFVTKGLKLGTYKIQVKVTAAGDEFHKSKSTTVTVQVKLYTN